MIEDQAVETEETRVEDSSQTVPEIEAQASHREEVRIDQVKGRCTLNMN